MQAHAQPQIHAHRPARPQVSASPQARVQSSAKTRSQAPSQPPGHAQLQAPAPEKPEEVLIPPYPQSDYIVSVQFDWPTLRLEAPGSDIFPVTWSDDGNMYAVWGDGGGFGGTNSLGRVPLGVARVSGNWDNYECRNIWGGHDPVKPSDFGGKSWGLISVDGVLYMWWAGDDSDMSLTKWGDNTALNECRIAVSSDYGESWTLGEKMFEKKDLLSCPTFLNFGKDNDDGARDGYVYSYFPRLNSTDDMWYDSLKNSQMRKPGKVDLARVPAGKIEDKDAYEFFAGFDPEGNPLWTRDISPAARKPVFTDSIGGVRTVSCTYDPGLRRYLFTTEHTRSGKKNLGTLGIFEAEEPWGPWKTVLYTVRFGMEPGGPGRLIGNLNFTFAPKWFSEDGTEFTMITTADGDNWGTVRGRFTVEVPAGE